MVSDQLLSSFASLSDRNTSKVFLVCTKLIFLRDLMIWFLNVMVIYLLTFNMQLKTGKAKYKVDTARLRPFIKTADVRQL